MTASSRLIGSILMILGTSIGAGMLALPIATAAYSFPVILTTLIACWFFSSLGALSLATLAIKLPPGSNIISMSETYCGKVGGVFVWLLYLALMYSLGCAYLTASGEIMSTIADLLGGSLPAFVGSALSAAVFFCVLYRGMSTIDWVNRIFMFAKASIYLLLIYAVIPTFNWGLLFEHPSEGWMLPTWSMITVILTSFGFSVIIPSLANYLDYDRKRIYTGVLIGSLIPFVVYLLWILLIQGILPTHGENSLTAIAKADSTNGALLTALHAAGAKAWLPRVIEAFMPISVVTSFLGVSLALSDFLADGLKIKKAGKGGLFIWALVLIPPLVIILLAPSLFLTALQYAGIICLLLLIIWPLVLLAKSSVSNPQ